MSQECVCTVLDELQPVCISQWHVERELSRLHCIGIDVPPTSLTNLQLVADFLSDPSLPSTPYSRSYAISCLLIGIITNNYIAQRQIFRPDADEEPQAYQDAIAMIKDDAQIWSSELNGWSYLYYRYARVELNVSQPRFREIFLVDHRTLNRWKHNSIGRLTMKIIKAEHRARKIAYNTQLYQHKRDPEIIKAIAAMEVKD